LACGFLQACDSFNPVNPNGEVFQMSVRRFNSLVIPFLLSLAAVMPSSMAIAWGGRACIGTYLVAEGSSEAQRLWTLSADGTFQGTASSEAEFSFSHQQGTWKATGRRSARAVVLDFYFIDTGEYETARLDINLGFSDRCRNLEGDFEIRFFAQGEDPLAPPVGPPDLADTFTGRRVMVD
jgi:hypothetical protein